MYAYVRSPGAHCRHGNYAPGSKVQTFGCYVTPLAPGETQTVRIKIAKIKSNLLLDAHAPGGDDRKGNDDAPTVVRVRR